MASLLSASSRPGPFFKDRVRDLKFVREHLDEIINDGGISGAYDVQQSKVALAGHSFGGYTTMLAAGAVMEVGQANPTVLDLETMTDTPFPREFDNGTPLDSSDDYGGFVSADAYLITGAMFKEPVPDSDPIDDFQTIATTRPNLTGHTYVRKPLMLITAEGSEPGGSGPGDFFDPVEDVTLINDAPAYGVAVTGANHMTATTTYGPILSWYRPLYQSDTTNVEDLTTEEASDKALLDVIAFVMEFLNEAYSRNGGAEDPQLVEEGRLGEYKRYSRSFFDAHLTPEYDFSDTDALGLSWLVAPVVTHENLDYVTDYYRRPVTQAFTIRDSANHPLVQFQSDGNLAILKGDLEVNSNIVNNLSVQDFLIKNDSGAIAARISTSTGDMEVKDSITDQVSSLGTTTAQEFVIRGPSDTAPSAH